MTRRSPRLHQGFFKPCQIWLLTMGALQAVSSQLGGGAAASLSATAVQECAAVTYDSGGAETFQAATTDPCP